MRFGYWMPVFGGWLRNIPDEGMEASWDYVKRLTQRSEETGWDLSLIAELNLNDIKGVDQPALDAWSTAAALAAVTSSIELMVAVRPNFHQPALFATTEPFLVAFFLFYVAVSGLFARRQPPGLRG